MPLKGLDVALCFEYFGMCGYMNMQISPCLYLQSLLCSHLQLRHTSSTSTLLHRCKIKLCSPMESCNIEGIQSLSNQSVILEEDSDTESPTLEVDGISSVSLLSMKLWLF